MGSLLELRSAFKNAAEHGVTELGASGDAGATDSEANAHTLYRHRVNSWPSSDPLVRSGGTMLTLNSEGTRLEPGVVWNDGFGAGGGGVSSVFARPWYQSGVQSVVGAARGTPDISMSAAVNGAVDIYWSYPPAPNGWQIVGGTSEASPEFAGIVAMADQVAGHRLGQLNPLPYGMHESQNGLVDVTKGNHSFHDVIGYNAGPGYDLVSGLGTELRAVVTRPRAGQRRADSGPATVRDLLPLADRGERSGPRPTRRRRSHPHGVRPTHAGTAVP